MAKSLHGGLILRRATPADTAALVAFTADVLRHQDAPEPDPLTAAWSRDLLQHRHPLVDAGSFCVVEDPRRGAIVSSVVLIEQVWRYAGVALRVGQPELVGTHPDYRGLGLVREQFQVIHEWAAERGLQGLFIDGIPWFYRQFGYEMAMGLRGGRALATARVPAAVADEPYRVRPAAAADLGFVAATEAAAASRYLMTCQRDAELWRYELHGRSDGSVHRSTLFVVETRDRDAVGYVALTPQYTGPQIALATFELKPGAVWGDVTPSVLRVLRSMDEQRAAHDPTGRCGHIGFWLGIEHPVYAVLDALGALPEPPWAWYVRVPDLPAFIRHIRPVLEQRLATSALAGHSGALHISFYRDGLHLVFERGHLTTVEPWRASLQLTGVERGQPTTAPRPDAMFPGLTFLQLLFGFRSRDELDYAFPDCFVRTDAVQALLNVLFPKQPSNVWPVL